MAKQGVPQDDTPEAPEATEPTGDGATAAAGATVDATGSDAGAEQAPATVESLSAELEAVRAESDSRREQVLRAQAELDNVRKRARRDVESAHKFGLEKVVTELLPVADSMELGLQAAQGDDAAVARVREGMELTLRMFTGALEKFGVKAVDPAGEAFNPEFHQAMTMQPAEGVEPGTVVTVVQKGYLLNDRLVRPAMVIVAQ